MYEVLVENLDTMDSFSVKTNETQCRVSDLQPDTTYRIRVQPSSSGGSGPWPQDAFVGRTLADTDPIPTIYWATNKAIHESDALGGIVRTFADTTWFQKWTSNPIHFVSMTWMHDLVYAVTNASQLFQIDIKHRNVSLIRNSDAISVASDWLGEKIYWSTRKLTVRL